jgi:alpha-L-arabinofuranosidase
VLGSRHNLLPVVVNYGEVVYAGVFLNMCIRHQELVPITNATALLHGGCIRKAAGQVYHDPQYTVIQKYTSLANSYQLAAELESPTYEITTAPDLGLPLDDLPYIDAIACLDKATGRVTVCAVNRHLEDGMELYLEIAGVPVKGGLEWEYMTYPDITAHARLGDAGRFAVQKGQVTAEGKGYRLALPQCSVSWIYWSI